MTRSGHSTSASVGRVQFLKTVFFGCGSELRAAIDGDDVAGDPPGLVRDEERDDRSQPRAVFCAAIICASNAKRPSIRTASVLLIPMHRPPTTKLCSRAHGYQFKVRTIDEDDFQALAFPPGSIGTPYGATSAAGGELPIGLQYSSGLWIQ
jgi:hypothetical protein